MTVLRERLYHLLRREPMLQFLVIGALVFAADHALRTDDRVIRITPAVRSEVARSVESRLGHSPDAAELQTELDHWKQEEVLYREAMKMRLLEKDNIVRTHLAGKLLDIARARTVTPSPTEAELRDYLQKHNDRYATPATHDFEQVFVERTHDDARARAAQLLARLRSGTSPEGLGDPFPRGRQFSGQPLSRIALLFGEPAAKQIASLPVGEWNLVEGQRGFHLVRVSRVDSGAPDFQQLREALAISLKSERQEQAAQVFVRDLERRYRFVSSE